VKQWSLGEDGIMSPEPVSTLLGKVSISVQFFKKYMIMRKCVKLKLEGVKL
jgi:hypothetical protein